MAFWWCTARSVRNDHHPGQQHTDGRIGLLSTRNARAQQQPLWPFAAL